MRHAPRKINRNHTLSLLCARLGLSPCSGRNSSNTSHNARGGRMMTTPALANIRTSSTSSSWDATRTSSNETYVGDVDPGARGTTGHTMACSFSASRTMSLRRDDQYAVSPLAFWSWCGGNRPYMARGRDLVVTDTKNANYVRGTKVLKRSLFHSTASLEACASDHVTCIEN